MRENLQSASTPQKSKKPERDESDELAKLFDDGTALPGSQTTTGTTGTGSTGGSSAPLPVAPARDFMKVANSIHREAVPAGLFKGKGKLIYDYLYSRTRGAIVPTRTVQASWREIMKAASIGSDKTLREQLKLLRAAGLVTWEWSEGAQGGSVYTVYLPEETTGTSGTPGTASTSGTSGQKIPAVPPVESTTGTGSLNVDTEGLFASSKTSFKTRDLNDDDEAFARLRQAAREVTGKDATDWRELDELLATELKIAAGRTTVSSAPAFLAEHLRRRLWKKDKQQMVEEGKGEAPQPAARADASKCPDCFGTGMWYPEGFENGVARCRHEKLTSDK